MRQHIHVVGFKRGGTTLMQQLFRCFKDTWVYDSGGIHIWDVSIPDNVTASTVVSKFSKDAYFVDQCLETPGAQIVYMIRDPRDTLTSQFKNSGVVAVNPAKLAHRIKELPKIQGDFLLVKYEDLVSDADRTQAVIADRFSLEIDIPFTEGYTRFSDDAPDQTLNGIRPPDTQGIGRWQLPEHREHVLQIVSEFPEMQEFIDRWYSNV